MKSRFCRIAVGAGFLAMTACAGIAFTSEARSQGSAPDLEKLVKYAQCIRANGYSEFPDPSPDGRMQLKLDRNSGTRLETAQRACKGMAPPGIAAAEQDVTPDRMQQLLGFAGCVRNQGVKDFPDPSPKGVFEITGPTPDMSAPQVSKALESCRESNPPGALSIRRSQPK